VSRSSRWRGAVLLAAAVVVAGCAGSGSQVSPAVFAPPSTTSTTAAPSPPTPATPGCTEGSGGTVVESTRPPAPMPAPGEMPAGSFMRTIQQRGRLIVGTSPDQLLFGYVNPLDDNRVEGLDADLLREVAIAIFGGNPADPATADAHIQFVTLTIAARIPDVTSGAVDIVADTMTINCQRRTQVDFSVEYYDAGQRVLTLANSTATSINGLGGKKVCAAAASTSIANLAAVPSHPVPYPVADQSDCLVLLQEGKVDAISTDDTVLAGLAAQDPFTKIIGPAFTDEPYGMAVSLSHPEFTAFVNGVLTELRSSGELKALYGTWLGKAFGQGLPAIPPFRYRS
jgi:polar amino acid transport system substrate-binding protein